MQLEVVKYRDILPIRILTGFVSGASQPTLEVKGEDFSSAETVFVNDVEASFSVINGNTIHVVVPEGMVNALRDLEVVSSKLTRTHKGSRLIFKIGTTPKSVSGILSLLQLYTKWLLQDPGSDIFNMSRGGGLQSIIGRAIETQKMENIISAVTRAVSTTASQIQAAQAQAPNLPLDERLLEASLVDIQRYENTQELLARVQVTSLAGSEAVTSLVL